MIRRRVMLEIQEGKTSLEAIVGDICLYNIGRDHLVILSPQDYNIGEYPLAKYSPVGLVTIPGAHDVYRDGSCGVMSLKHMNMNAPATGENLASPANNNLVFPIQGPLVGMEPTFAHVGTCYYSELSDGVVTRGTTSGILPQTTVSQTYIDNGSTIVPNATDPGTYYSQSSDAHIFSPYKSDGTFNPQYSAYPDNAHLGPSAMSDFDGVGNTQKMIEAEAGQPAWKTDSVIASTGSDHYSAALCCQRYSVNGMPAGSWYLPSIGELGYCTVRNKELEEAREELVGRGLPNRISPLYLKLLSSTYYPDGRVAWCLFNASVYSAAPTNGAMQVRAFCRVKI